MSTDWINQLKDTHCTFFIFYFIIIPTSQFLLHEILVDRKLIDRLNFVLIFMLDDSPPFSWIFHRDVSGAWLWLYDDDVGLFNQINDFTLNYCQRVRCSTSTPFDREEIWKFVVVDYFTRLWLISPIFE